MLNAYIVIKERSDKALTLKLVKKGLTERHEQCPNCDDAIFILRDEEGWIKKLYGATKFKDKIRCDNCESILEYSAIKGRKER